MKLSQLFNLKRNTGRRVNAKYDAAQTNADNVRHWSASDGLSADMATAFEVRKTLRERSRYEVNNNSYAKGLVQMLANDTIGTGPRLQMLTADEKINSKVESDFQQWAECVRLSGKLRTMRMVRCQDGEVFAIIATNPKVKSNVKIDLMLVEADRITDNTYNLRDLSRENIIDGIKYDDYGNPISYRVLKYHPGDYTVFKPDDVMTISAEYMIHVFLQDRPGQHRGVPEITAALPLFAQLRRYNSAVLSAAEAAASFAAVLYTDAPPDGETEALEPLDTVPLERNTM
ncbi:MAG: phage portal protein, partial [Oscillospiraceae bacterium]